MSSISHIEMDEGQTEVHRENLRNLSSVTARLEGRDLGSAMKEIKDRLFKEVPLPSGTEIEFGGLYQVQQESFMGLSQVLLGSIVLIFIVLVFEFRSVTSPIVLPDWKHSFAKGSGSSGSEGECATASQGISSEEVG